jgi:hypothetical protein
MSAFGKIRADFSAMLAAYPKYDHLPAVIQKHMDELNKDLKPGQHKNTPCCFQVSYAFNAAGQRIYPHSYRRLNCRLAGNYYIGAVDELERYLDGRYGSTEDIRTDASGKQRDQAEMKKCIDGLTGILVFRDRGYGVHTELWNADSIIQKQGAPGGMNEHYIFSQPRILFWEITIASDTTLAPRWLQGWWSVWDGKTVYYYFSDQHGVIWQEKQPKSASELPTGSVGNSGTVTVSASDVKLVWLPRGGGTTIETFQRGLSNGEPRKMNGTSNRFSPLVATKLF